MHTEVTIALRRAALAVVALGWIAAATRADVTESKTMTMGIGFGTIHTSTTEWISGDKKRTDTSTRCDGFLLSMVCGHLRGGEIVRLDKNVSWRLDPKHRSYTETAFPTPAQIAEVRQQRAELLKKIENCPRPTAQRAADTSQCDMSPPKFDVRNTGETATIAGHLARHSVITMTQTCTRKDTGDACEYVVRIDAWMTDDPIPGYVEERAFDDRVAKRMELDETTMTSFAPQLQRFTAPYAQALKEVGAKAKDLHGIPLKTAISVSFGGTRCGAAKQQAGAGGVTANAGSAAETAAENSTSAAAGNATEQAVTHSTGGSLLGSIAGSAAGAFGHSLLSGFFAKKSSAASKPAPAPAAGAVPMVTLFSVTTETTEIRSDSIASREFDVPADWIRHAPKAANGPPQFSCPTVGT